MYGAPLITHYNISTSLKAPLELIFILKKQQRKLESYRYSFLFSCNFGCFMTAILLYVSCIYVVHVCIIVLLFTLECHLQIVRTHPYGYLFLTVEMIYYDSCRL